MNNKYEYRIVFTDDAELNSTLSMGKESITGEQLGMMFESLIDIIRNAKSQIYLVEITGVDYSVKSSIKIGIDDLDLEGLSDRIKSFLISMTYAKSTAEDILDGVLDVR